MLKKLVSPAWAIFEYGSYPLLLLVATPWFLRQLGTEQYGHWMLLAAVVSFGGVLNAGTGASTVKAISAGIGRKEPDFSSRAVNASIAIAMLGGGGLAIIVFSTFWLGASAFLERMGDPELVRLTGIAAAAIIWLEQLDNVFSSAMKGAEQFGAAARVEIISKTTQIVAAAIILYDFPTLTALYSTLLGVAILRLAAKIVVTRRLLGLSKLRPSFRHASEILHFAKWGWLQGVGGVLFGVADRMFIGSLLGATSLTYYSIASQLALQVHAVSAAGLSVIFPKVSRSLEHGGAFSLWRFTKITFIGNLLLSTALAAALLLFGPAFLQIWIGSEAAIPTARLLPWLVIAYWILALNIVFYYLLLGMGRIRFVSITVVISGIFAALVAYLSISIVGLIGAPAGRAAYAILTLALVIPVVQQLRLESNVTFSMPTKGPSPESKGML
jgi:O-antigen/teichoic acid export membrane protein